MDVERSYWSRKFDPDMSAPRVSKAAPASMITERRDVRGEIRRPLMCRVGSPVMFVKGMVCRVVVWRS